MMREPHFGDAIDKPNHHGNEEYLPSHQQVRPTVMQMAGAGVRTDNSSAWKNGIERYQ